MIGIVFDGMCNVCTRRNSKACVWWDVQQMYLQQ